MREPNYITEPIGGGKVLFRCQQPACWTMVSVAEGDLERFALSHSKKNCPSKGNKRKVGGSLLKSIIEIMWEEVDAAMALLSAPPTSESSHEHLRGQLHGMTKMLFIMSGPYFKTHDDVKREALARYRAHVAGEEYVTAGCGNITFAHDGRLVPVEDPSSTARRIERARGDSTGNRIIDANIRKAYLDGDEGGVTKLYEENDRRVSLIKGASETSGRPPKQGAAAIFTLEQVEKIKAQHEAGFDLKMLSMAYKCSEAAILQAIEVGA